MPHYLSRPYLSFHLFIDNWYPWALTVVNVLMGRITLAGMTEPSRSCKWLESGRKTKSPKTNNNLEIKLLVFQSTFTFKANAPNKSNGQQVNSTCFEKEPLEKRKAKVTGLGATEFRCRCRIDLNCITDDWSGTNHSRFCNTPTMIPLYASNQLLHTTLRKCQLDSTCVVC